MDFARIYEEEPEAYDHLVSAEDADGVLLPALAARVDPAGARCVDVGVGTARIARQLVDAGATVMGLDAAATCAFFFGEELAARVRAAGWSRIPECTGMWVARR